MPPALSTLALVTAALLIGATPSGAQASPSGFGFGGPGYAAPRSGGSTRGAGGPTRGLAPAARPRLSFSPRPDERSRFGLAGADRRYSPRARHYLARGYGVGYGYPFALGYDCGLACEGALSPGEVVTVEVPTLTGSVGIRPSPVEPPAIYVIGDRQASTVRGSMRRSKRTLSGVVRSAGATGISPSRIIQVKARR